MTLSVFPIKAYDDNYIWCIHNQHHCVVVDPGDAIPVIEYCQQQQLELVAIIITHHHWDHTNGIDALLNKAPDIDVYGPINPNIKQITVRLSEGDKITLPKLALNFSILEVPGHTLDHIAYFGSIGLFCGDSLFSAGCGRLFEGTPQQMYHSLSKLKALPRKTSVYCTHEYTLANIDFAQTVEPNNKAMTKYKAWAKQQRLNNLPTLPSSIGNELSINPFLRCDNDELIAQVIQHHGGQLSTNEAIFAALRRWKDNF